MMNVAYITYSLK